MRLPRGRSSGARNFSVKREVSPQHDGQQTAGVEVGRAEQAQFVQDLGCISCASSITKTGRTRAASI